MIKNERQYRITRAQADKFEKTLRELESASPVAGLHPTLHKAQIDALRSQLQDLQEELAEYDSLRSGKRPVVELDSFELLPRALIQSRIAAGLTQEQLAEKVGVKPQQIQRYEATDYRSASLQRVAEVVRALGIGGQDAVFESSGKCSLRVMLQRLKSVGLEEGFVIQRLLPKAPGILSTDEREGEQDGSVAMEAAEGIHRIYGWTPSLLFGSQPLALGRAASATARFKLPARVREAGLEAYVLYAHYLALLVLQATPHLAVKQLPQDAVEVRERIISAYGELTFDAALKYAWSLGIPVLALNDPGLFHGACWRINGRNVIVLKQRTRSVARWLNDLLHEYFHAANNPDLEEHPVIEEDEMSPTRRQSKEELAASRFAGDVMLGGRAEELAERCVEAAKGSVERLKSAVTRVAKQEGVAIDALANYMAFRLSLQNINWWGAATNLQSQDAETLCTPRDFLLEYANLTRLNYVDRDLLLRALEPMVLAFSGKMGSGKSTLSEHVAKALDWKRASFGDYVRKVAKDEGLDEDSRDVLQELGARLVKSDPEEFCRDVLAEFDWRSGEPLIVEGIRHAEIVEALRRVVAPLEVRLVFLEVTDVRRIERLRIRDSEVVERLKQIESHSTEEQASTVLPEMADLRVSGDKSISELVLEIVTWVHQGDGKPNPCTA
jgi:cytidylate kinase/transcriptional regulator with XRE-family HTH domain